MFKNWTFSIKLKMALPIGLIAFVILSVMTFVIARDSHKVAKENAEAYLTSTAQAHARTIRITFENAQTTISYLFRVKKKLL